MISGKCNSKTLLDLSLDRAASKESRGKKAFRDGVNQRADIKQGQVVDMICKVVDGKADVIKKDLCSRRIIFKDLKLVDSLDISYHTRNNLFSRIFDLVIETEISADETIDIPENIEIRTKYNGAIKITDLDFMPMTQNPSAVALAERLNSIKIIKDRIFHLELIDFKLRYETHKHCWYVGIATGKGSSVWMLFPPAVMLTPFKEADSIKMLELFQLIRKEITLFNV